MNRRRIHGPLALQLVCIFATFGVALGQVDNNIVISGNASMHNGTETDPVLNQFSLSPSPTATSQPTAYDPLPIIEETPPTLTPTAAPIAPVPTETPTLFPTQTLQPTPEPSISLSPSVFPSLSFKPSSSLQPSMHPTRIPSEIPSYAPTSSPSLPPSVSFEPTVSSFPTISAAPSTSTQPSSFPSESPSDSPSQGPSESSMPSNVPSISPSNFPTVSIEPSSVPSISNQPTSSMRPSSIPSVPPTQSSVPTDLPSYLPTNYPTKVPSSEPTDIPSAPPTLGIKEVTEKLIHMTLEGLEELTDEEQKEWEDMTSHHVFRYFDELNDSLPGLAPINITKVETTFIGQSSATRPELGPARSLQDRPVLGIDYTQTIYFGVWDEDLNEEDINWYIFIAPFEYDSQSYLIDLIEQWELENWVDLLSVEVGQASESPSQTPTDAPPSDGERNVSRGAIGTSIGIVVFACLVVCALLYDRYRNEERYRQARAQMNMENIEDVGPQMDWKNPNCIVVDSSNGAHPDPQDVRARQDQSGKGSRHRRNRSRDSLRSSNQGNGSRHSRDSLGLPPLPPGITAISPLPPGSPHDRHVSDVTEVSYLSGSRSDNGSDDNPLLMPMDERFPVTPDDSGPLSPLHIPDEEDVDFSGLSPPSSPGETEVGPMLGLAAETRAESPSMSGFDMQIQELE